MGLEFRVSISVHRGYTSHWVGSAVSFLGQWAMFKEMKVRT